MGADACRLVRENLQRTGLTGRAQVVQADYLRYLERRQGPFGIIFLDPPYAEVFLENALEKISEIDILANRGIIVNGAAGGEGVAMPFPRFGTVRGTIRYGKTLITIFRKKIVRGCRMKTAIYPGSFDPVTNGHLNIIRRAAHIFDKLIVCVMVNAGKKPLFSQEERTEMLRRVTRDLPNVEVDAAGELLATYAKRRGSCVVVKGLRATSDFENEFQMALINHKINPDLDTMFLTAEHQYMYLSSSTVKELACYDVELAGFPAGRDYTGLQKTHTSHENTRRNDPCMTTASKN